MDTGLTPTDRSQRGRLFAAHPNRASGRSNRQPESGTLQARRKPAAAPTARSCTTHQRTGNGAAARRADGSRELRPSSGVPCNSQPLLPACRGTTDRAQWLRPAFLLTLLDWKWSPRQIAATHKRVFLNEPDRHKSHEPIYTATYAQPRGELRRQLVACLRQGRSTRLPRTRGTDWRGQIPDMVNIHVRPPRVEDRVMLGHWEGDFNKGAATTPRSACWWSARAAWC